MDTALPKFIKTEKQCTSCDSHNTVLHDHGIDYQENPKVVKVFYRCHHCDTKFGFTYSGGFIEVYEKWCQEPLPVAVA